MVELRKGIGHGSLYFKVNDLCDRPSEEQMSAFITALGKWGVRRDGSFSEGYYAREAVEKYNAPPEQVWVIAMLIFG